MQRGDQEINRCVTKSGTGETLCSLDQALNTNGEVVFVVVFL